MVAIAMPNVVNGTNDSEILRGTNGEDEINGLNGDDLIQAGGGADAINGGFGADRIFGGGGNDSINGEGGDDEIFGSTGNDMINGGSGNDTIDGGAQNDTIDGGDGVDTITGGAGMDTLTGGANTDTFLFDASTATAADTDTITDFTASDKIDVMNSEGFLVTFVQSGADVLIIATDDATSTPVTLAVVQNAMVEVVEARTFFNGAPVQPIPPGLNIINGTDNAETLVGTLGDDQINGLGRDDLLQGGAGHDYINGGFGADVISGGGGNDFLNGDEGNDLIFGSTGQDVISGGEGNDDLRGGAQNDALIGGDGIDTLDGGSGADTLTGGADRDLFVLDAGLANEDLDLIMDFSAEDDILINNAGGKEMVFTFVFALGGTAISADGVAVAVVFGATPLEVIEATDFDAEPASVEEGIDESAPRKEIAGIEMGAEMLADVPFEFVEASAGDMAPAGAPVGSNAPAAMTMSSIFSETILSPFTKDDDDGLVSNNQDWMVINSGMDLLI